MALKINNCHHFLKKSNLDPLELNFFMPIGFADKFNPSGKKFGPPPFFNKGERAPFSRNFYVFSKECGGIARKHIEIARKRRSFSLIKKRGGAKFFTRGVKFIRESDGHKKIQF